MSISGAGESPCPRNRDDPLVSPLASSVCAVTVTYGDRQHLLRLVLLSLLKQTAIWKIVVVNNGAQWNVQQLAEELAPGRIEVVDLGTNRGSAPGFAAGIRRACELGTNFIWLLDDDNEPHGEALSELLAAYGRLRNDFAEDKLAVLAFRPDQQRSVSYHLSARQVGRRPSTFWGFHVFGVPYKLWRHTPWGRPRLLRTLPSQVEMTTGPYGGLFFSPAVVEAHGLPRDDFVIYEDDTEFTHRITRGGGTIRLITAAKVADLDPSWHLKKHFGNSFRLWLQGSSDTRIYYGARNQTYLDRHCFPCSRLAYWINRQVFCSIMWMFALSLGRTGRRRLLQSAIRDGLAGRLGLAPRFPLQ